MDYSSRHLPRLTGFSYSRNGYYFITICTKEKQHRFSRIEVVDSVYRRNHLTAAGIIAEQQLLLLPERFPNIRIDKYVIMPNHIHMILVMEHPDGQNANTVSDIIGAYKSITAVQVLRSCGIPKLFQTSFHDHIIRNQQDDEKIWLVVIGFSKLKKL